jgi:peptide deformylase
MILDIVKYGDPVLRARGKLVKEVNTKLRQLALDMLETMEAARGVGLAAHQVGVPIQMAVIDVADVEDRPSTMAIDGKPVPLAEQMPLILLNPELALGKEKESGNEGCLSFPELSAEIIRSREVEVRAQTLDGKPLEFTATGLLARALQHEVDHLHGVLFIDRMSSAAKASLAGKLKRLQKETRGE